MKRYTLLGIVISVAWLTFMGLLLYSKWPSTSSLPLNEWGDFFAGMMAPLAFLWLVLGYIQQGEELRLNTDALIAQQTELKRQVAETAALVAQSERQAAAAESLALATMSESQRIALKEKIEAMPIFRAQGGTYNAGNTVINIKNVGATVKELIVFDTLGQQMPIKPADIFEAGTAGKLKVNNVTAWPFCFSISFTDKFGIRHTKEFEMKSQFEFVEKGEALFI